MIHVVTPTIPSRAHLLRQCVTSVAEQTVNASVVHHVMLDDQGLGPAEIRNAVVGGLQLDDDDWLCFLDDDDLWDPGHLAALLPHMGALTDVVFSLARVEGRPGWDPQLDHFDRQRMIDGPNYLPLCGVAVRAPMFPGFPDDRYEDWGMLRQLAVDTAAWVCVPERTWSYRFGAWDSRSKQCWRGER